jgi:Pyridoxamine 5'-phosphate oxidase
MTDIELVKGLASDADYMAVAAVARPDGRVHASLVKAGVLDDPVAGELSVGVVVAGGARKLELMRRAGRASATFTDGYRWVSVEGPVHLVGPDDPPEVVATDVASTIRDVFKAAGGTHEDWAAFDATMATERRCAVFIELEGILTNRLG